MTGGSILVAGGLNAADVLINYTGTSEFRFSGGGNTSRVYGTILAPNATVGLHPGFVLGSVIANAITMSSGADVIRPVPEVTPGSVIFGFLGLVVAYRFAPGAYFQNAGRCRGAEKPSRLRFSPKSVCCLKRRSKERRFAFGFGASLRGARDQFQQWRHCTAARLIFLISRTITLTLTERVRQTRSSVPEFVPRISS